MVTPQINTLQQRIHESAEKYKNHEAYRILNKDKQITTYTYREVYEKALKIAYFMNSRNIESQARIGIYASNSPQWAIICLGILLNNNVVVPIDPLNGQVELSHIIQDAQIDYIFVSSSLAYRLTDFNLKSYIIIDGQASYTESREYHTIHDIFENSITNDSLNIAQPDDVVTIIYTSGTTSEPKGVMLTHKSILFDINAMLKVFPVDCTDNFLSVLVLSHSFELCCGLFLPFCIGASVTYCTSLKYTTIFKNMSLFSPTVMYAVPALFSILLDKIRNKIQLPGVDESNNQNVTEIHGKQEFIEKSRQLLGGKLRYFVSGGAPLAESIIDGFQVLGIPLLQVYGLTECSPVLTMTPPDNPKPGSAGKALPGIEIRIKKEPGREIGEIIARGQNLMKGYNNNPEATRRIIKDGWLYTQDIGYMDHDGWLYITGRAKNVIVTSAGVNVYPEEIESYIVKSPFIKEVCVLGKPDTDKTETVFAVVVVNGSRLNEHIRSRMETDKSRLTSQRSVIQEEIQNYTKDLASFKNVLNFMIYDNPLPRGRTNKILRNELKKILGW